jgi:hypothetical protein
MGANGQYVVQEERKEGACCSTWRRTACQAEGQVYQVSDELFNFSWFILKLETIFKKRQKRSKNVFCRFHNFCNYPAKNQIFQTRPFLLNALVREPNIYICKGRTKLLHLKTIFNLMAQYWVLKYPEKICFVQIGSEWLSADPCTWYACTKGETGEAQLENRTLACNTTCHQVLRL